MKLKWGRRTLTFMVIPDANNKVVRFRVSTFLLYIIPVLLLVCACITLAIFLNNMQNKLEKNELLLELADKKRQFEETLVDKDVTISELQNEIIDITEQTEEMRLKVEELKRLEEEIRTATSDMQQITGKTSGSVSISSMSTPTSTTPGIGGDSRDLTPEDTHEFIADTKSELVNLESDMLLLLTNISEAKQNLLEHIKQKRITPSIWPTTSSNISSTFGYRKDPFTRRPAYHAGVDISGKRGDPVYATADGVVTSAGYDKSYGYNVIIKHSSGLSTRYGHLKKYTVKKGQTVSQGEQIGQLGSTGRSTGPHLHYEVIKNGKTIDPKPYMETAS